MIYRIKFLVLERRTTIAVKEVLYYKELHLYKKRRRVVGRIGEKIVERYSLISKKETNSTKEERYTLLPFFEVISSFSYIKF